jgi:putative FmdB family regulatory protein
MMPAVPTYDYECRTCGNRFDLIHSMREDGPTACELCGGALRRVLYPTGIIFKGSGFYSTDSRSGDANASRGSKATTGDSATAADGTAAKPPGGQETGGGPASGEGTGSKPATGGGGGNGKATSGDRGASRESSGGGGTGSRAGSEGRGGSSEA